MAEDWNQSPESSSAGSAAGTAATTYGLAESTRAAASGGLRVESFDLAG